jgi:hypothetical protein
MDWPVHWEDAVYGHCLELELNARTGEVVALHSYVNINVPFTVPWSNALQ